MEESRAPKRSRSLIRVTSSRKDSPRPPGRNLNRSSPRIKSAVQETGLRTSLASSSFWAIRAKSIRGSATKKVSRRCPFPKMMSSLIPALPSSRAKSARISRRLLSDGHASIDVFVIPGRAACAGPESILRSAGLVDSGLAAVRRPGMTGEM